MANSELIPWRDREEQGGITGPGTDPMEGQ